MPVTSAPTISKCKRGGQCLHFDTVCCSGKCHTTEACANGIRCNHADDDDNGTLKATTGLIRLSFQVVAPIKPSLPLPFLSSRVVAGDIIYNQTQCTADLHHSDDTWPSILNGFIGVLIVGLVIIVCCIFCCCRRRGQQSRLAQEQQQYAQPAAAVTPRHFPPHQQSQQYEQQGPHTANPVYAAHRAEGGNGYAPLGPGPVVVVATAAAAGQPVDAVYVDGDDDAASVKSDQVDFYE
jgi:hypothetical protein